MQDSDQTGNRTSRLRLDVSPQALLLAIAMFASLSSGCASLLNPATGIPANRLPPELLGEPKAGMETIDLALLGQKQPDVYRLGPGDVLGVWVEGILGETGQLPPAQLSERSDLPPALGYPVPIRDNGTLALPLVKPLLVKGMTIEQAEQAIINAYTVEKQILQAGRERIIVTLMRKRTYHVLVIRQESAGLLGQPVGGGAGRGGAFGTVNVFSPGKQGSGHAVDLPAYKNDVLNALAETGGLPGLDAVNEIVIRRGVFAGIQERDVIRQQIKNQAPNDKSPPWSNIRGREIVRIPLRMRPGEKPPFTPDDVILNTGDVVFIESRTEFFYTGGLLGSGQHVLPRDYDLDVIGAMALVGGPIANGGFNQGNISSGSVVAGGVGDVTPSTLVVLRPTPGGGQLPIQVDLNDALRDPRRRILIQPGDVLILQQTPGEAVARYLSGVLGFSFGFAKSHTRGDTTLSGSGSGSFP